MSRHVIDRRAAPESGRTRHYFDLDRREAGEGSHPASHELHRRPASREGAARVRAYLAIERGRSA
ncbi:MAG: hypothetical protein ACOY5U_05575 [Pseudomonadota bacterium]|jgi:hypothetical protein